MLVDGTGNIKMTKVSEHLPVSRSYRLSVILGWKSAAFRNANPSRLP